MESLVHAFLSNALVAAGLALIPMILGRANRSPALVHALWIVVLIKLVTPPLLPVSVAIPAPAAMASEQAWPDRGASPGLGSSPVVEPSPAHQHESTDAGIVEIPKAPEQAGWELDHAGLIPEPGSMAGDEAPPAEATPNPTVQAWYPRWEAVALTAILAGAGVFWLTAALRIVRVRRLLRDLRPAPGREQDRAVAVARRLGLKRAPDVMMAPGRIPPMLWAFGGRTRLLLPSELWDTLEESQQTALLAHELAHLKRKDHWVRWLDLIVAGLYWWHPVVWLARRSMREAEELCCDAWAVWAAPRGAKTYAAALLAALDFVSASPTAEAAPALAVISGRLYVRFLHRRMRMIVQSTTPRHLSLAGRLGLFALSALILPLAPTWGRSPDTPTDVEDERAAVSRDAESSGLALAAELASQDGKAEADDDDDDDRKQEHADRLEHLLKDLGEQVSKDLGPVAQEVAKALEKAVKEVGEAIDKDGIVSKDLQNALEKAGDELRESFKSGGPVDQQARESAERARAKMREAVEKARQELQSTVRDRADRAREAAEKARQELEGTVRERAGRAREEVEKAREVARRGLLQEGEDKTREEERAPGADEADQPADLQRARREVRQMEEQLRRAMRRLEALQRREELEGRRARREERPARGPRRGDAPAPPASPVPPVPPEPPHAGDHPAPPVPPEPPHAGDHPAPPSPPAAPGRADAPRGPRGPLGPRGPVGPRGGMRGMPGPGMGGPGGPPVANPRMERRLRELEEKMDRLLNELQNLKGDKKSDEKPKDSKPKGSAVLF